jgi:hypothetical protein
MVDDKEHKEYLKFEVDTLRNEKVIVKHISVHKNFNLNLDVEVDIQCN